MLDELYSHIVGFISRYLPSGTIEHNLLRTFKLK